MLLNFFHEKYQGLNVVLSVFRGLEKYRQYCGTVLTLETRLMGR